MTAATSPDGTVRPARPEDAGEIAAVHVGTWQHAYAGLLPDDFLAGLDIRQRTGHWQTRISEPRNGALVLVFEQLGRVRGFVSAGPSRDGDAGGEVYAIYVDPVCQEQGAGTRLLAAAARRLAEAGFTEASLWVLADNHPSRRFYESRGWRPDGTARRGSYGEGGSVMELRYVRPLTSLPG